MRRGRVPLWIYFAAGAFLFYYGVLVYSELWPPRRIGLDCESREGGIVIAYVASESAAGRAGLHPGDRVVAVDGSNIHTWEEWRGFLAIREIGRTYRFEIERAGHRSEAQLIPGRQPGDPLVRLERKRYVQFILLLLALVLVWKGAEKPAVRIGAWLLAAIGTAPLFPDAEMTAIWRNLPVWLGIVLWIPQVSHLMLLPLFFTFFALFPRRLFHRLWPWLVVWAPAIGLSAWWFPHVYEHIYHPPVLAEVPAWFRFTIGGAILAYGGGALAALVLNYCRLPISDERRRMRVLVAGGFVGLLPTLLFLTAMFWGTLTQSRLVWMFVSTPYRLFALGLFMAFPLALVYALAGHRASVSPGSQEKSIR